MPYFFAFLGLATLIILHEGGHFVAAKAVGMRVERFSLFFGPRIAKKQIGETEYGIGVIPLGGYVKITGMTAGEMFETPDIEARSYYNQPVWKRIVVISAGPLVNIVVAIILAWVFFLGQQRVEVTPNGQPISTNTVGALIKGSAAIGVLKVGDQLVSVDGVSGGPETLRRQIESHKCAGKLVNGCRAATPVKLVVRRDGVRRTLTVYPRYDSADHEMLVGFAFQVKTAPTGVVYAAGQSVSGLWRVTKLTVSDLVQIFKPKERKQLNGIVGATAYTASAISQGPSQTLEILALISLSLGVINLFPFLPLDGGHIFWAVVEKIRGRKVSFATMERAGLIGVALLVGLFLIGLSNDITAIAHGTLTAH